MNTAYKAMSAKFELHFQYHKIAFLILVSVAKTHAVTLRLRGGVHRIPFLGRGVNQQRLEFSPRVEKRRLDTEVAQTP